MVRETESRSGQTVTDEAAAPSANGAAQPAVAEREAVQARPGVRHHRDLTTGSIPKNLFHQSWPQALEGVFTVADQLTDLVWAGRLEAGFRAVASVGVVQT
jgi:hypothetical protein